jgi:ATP-binding cassette subfamily F protein uup
VRDAESGVRTAGSGVPGASVAPSSDRAPRTADPAPRQASASRKLSYKEQRELEALPARIEELEGEQARLRAESESPEFYKTGAEHIKQVLARLDALAPELEATLARWMELEERN